MRNVFYRITGAMARLMYGRNGTDQLNIALLIVYLVLCVLRAATLIFFTDSTPARMVWDGVLLALAVVILFRIFSRNLSRRRAENQRFLSWWAPIRNRAVGARQRRLDKEHRYFTCQNCKTICRVPAGKGKIELTCPRCGNRFVVRS